MADSILSINADVTSGGDINFDVRVMHGYRKFCNKIYQATKYVLGKLDASFTPQQHPTKTNQESLPERWILHKFTIAAAEVDRALTTREFSQATSIIYQYWYTNLCDVYIENSKALILDGSPAEQESAKQTLYTVLEGGLTMIHPFMPFLTEELWQRLPRRPNDSTPSIVRAAYPKHDPVLDDPASEEAYELLLAVSKAIRSLTVEYAIKDSAIVYIQLFDSPSLETCTAHLPSIRSLSGKIGSSLTLTILDAEAQKPTGCVVAGVSASAAVFLQVKGKVDLEAEIRKAGDKLEKANERVKRQRGIVGDEGWKSKVDAKLQDVEKKKLGDWEAEVRELEGSLSRWEKLRLE